jgi:hypothetical protein
LSQKGYRDENPAYETIKLPFLRKHQPPRAEALRRVQGTDP